MEMDKHKNVQTVSYKYENIQHGNVQTENYTNMEIYK